MDSIGYIEIIVKGKRGNLELTPDLFDIREIREVLEQAENLLMPNKGRERPIISYQIEEGSVKNIFKTSIQYVIAFNAIVLQVKEHQSVDFLDLPTARAFESFQNLASKNNYSVEFRTSLHNSNNITLDITTNYRKTASTLADAEFYFYGKITSLGGKDRSTIHILTDDFGSLTIQTKKDYLTQLRENILYKEYGVRAAGKQDSETGEVDRSNLVFLDLVEYQPRLDEDYLKRLRLKASVWLNNIDTDQWLREVRGDYGK